MQRLPETVPKFNYYMEWDNVAALNIENFDYWWEKQIPKQTRNHVRRAQKSGVVVKIAKFDDEFVQGISEIYNESPIRQGKPFWHYKMDLESIQRTHSTYLNSSDFIGAYIDGELIGFIKMVYVGETARTMQIIAKNAHRDKAPTNALLAKAIEICSGKGVKYLVYGRYDYGKIGSKSLEVFKSENGFKEVLIPRYYIPLCLKGKLILTMKLHQGFKEILPEKTIAFMLDLRKKWFMKKYDQA
jgi:hypothetical protein